MFSYSILDLFDGLLTPWTIRNIFKLSVMV